MAPENWANAETLKAMKVSFTGLARITRLGPAFSLGITICGRNLPHILGQPCAICRPTTLTSFPAKALYRASQRMHGGTGHHDPRYNYEFVPCQNDGGDGPFFFIPPQNVYTTKDGFQKLDKVSLECTPTAMLIYNVQYDIQLDIQPYAF